MAITKVGAMTDPPVAGDYTILQAKLDAYAKQIGNQGMILTQWVNTTTTPAIALGSYITHGGTLFVVDTEDFAVTEPAGDGTFYLKVSASGDTLSIVWLGSLAGYTWNAIYNGLYHADESQILPYQLVKAGAVLTKRKITNLMQGSGFVTVDWTGATNYVNQGVKTTDSPTFDGLTLSGMINTGQGSTKIYKETYQHVTTDSYDSTPYGERSATLSSMSVGEIKRIKWSNRPREAAYNVVCLPSGGTYAIYGRGMPILSGGSFLVTEGGTNVSDNIWQYSSFVIWRVT